MFTCVAICVYENAQAIIKTPIKIENYYFELFFSCVALNTIVICTPTHRPRGGKRRRRRQIGPHHPRSERLSASPTNPMTATRRIHHASPVRADQAEQGVCQHGLDQDFSSRSAWGVRKINLDARLGLCEYIPVWILKVGEMDNFHEIKNDNRLKFALSRLNDEQCKNLLKDIIQMISEKYPQLVQPS
jgi:hypothetical protein